MPQNSAPVAFPTWRDHWAKYDGVTQLLTAADKALRRRAAGNHRLPPPAKCDNEAVLTTVRAMRAWACGEPPKDPSKRPTLARRMMRNLKPVWPAILWPRWLFLECAFLDASISGDLLFAAVTLRTMCEELQRLHALDLGSARLAALAGSDREDDNKQLLAFFSVAWTSLDLLPNEMRREGKDWPLLKDVKARRPELQNVRAKLHAYVHPNYGSHIVALFPERAEAARLLLDATAIAYEHFFSLSWAETGTGAGSALLRLAPIESWEATAQRFVDVALPAARSGLSDPSLVEFFKAPNALNWLKRNDAGVGEMLADPQVAPLVADLPRRSLDAAGTGAAAEFRLWEGARAIDVFDLAAARRQEQTLSDEALTGAPGTEDQKRWLRFQGHSLKLAMLLDRTKANAFKIQLVRQIARGNPIGILLCVRSLVEHRALAVWLPDAIARSLDDMAARVRAREPLPEAEAAKLDQQIANFLAVKAKGAQKTRRPWTTREEGGARKARLDLGAVVDAAFPADDFFRTAYGLASAAMHGRSCRAFELTRPASAEQWASRLGVMVLERLCHPDEELAPLFAAATLAKQIAHAEQFGGTKGAATDRMANQTFGQIDQPLVPGEDYLGDGTAEKPFQIAAHLEYYAASIAILKQLGVDYTEAQRQVQTDGAGRLCDCYTALEREFWFLIRAQTLED